MKRVIQRNGVDKPEKWYAPLPEKYDAPVFKYEKDALKYLKLVALQKQIEKLEEKADVLENELYEVERADYLSDFA
jgi:hypothetical protein